MKKGCKAVIATLVSAAMGVIAGGVAILKLSTKEMREQREMLNKEQVLYYAFNSWFQIRQEGRTLVEYFKKNNYKTVAIYGMKELGERLVDELKDSEIEVCYAIDKNADQIYSEVDVVTLDDELKPVDIIVVTAIYYFDEIEEALSSKVDFPIVSLEDILCGM